MYAIIQTGGKQYRVSKGDLVQVELLDPGAEKVQFDQVYLVSNGRDTVVGTPVVAGAKVKATVVGTGRWPKILVFKKKRRKHYKRTIGHRQYFTAVRIEEIDAGGVVKPLAEEVAAAKPARAAAHRKAAKKKAAPRKKVAAKKKAAARKAAPKKKAATKKKTSTRKAGGRKTVKKSTRKTAAKTTKKTTRKKSSRS
jgi:large subunit ribosomal protein L21